MVDYVPRRKAVLVDRDEPHRLRHPALSGEWIALEGPIRSKRRALDQGAGTPDLTSWGFNTIGWAQEVIIRTQTIHRHSRAWTHEAYQWADMPYCHLLPFTEAHQWEVETRLPDVFSEDFEQWCDTVAREHCAQMAEDPNLIGYFYCDCPTWVHTRPNNPTGPWFDPTRLESAEGRDELARMTERYYKVTHDAVRRYDPNHLILGDRYEGKGPAAGRNPAGRVTLRRHVELSVFFGAEPDRG